MNFSKPFPNKLKVMKKLYIGIILSLLGFNCLGQGWEWVKSAGYNNGNYQKELFKRNKANGYFISLFQEEYNQPKKTEIIYSNEYGEEIWRKTLPKITINDFIFNGNEIFIAGNFIDTISINGNTVISKGNSDGIVGILNAQGNFINYNTFGSDGPETTNSITFKNNDLFITGRFQKTFIFNNLHFNGSINNTFLIKLNSALAPIIGFQSISSCCGGSYGITVGIDNEQYIYLLTYNDSKVVYGTDTAYTYDDGNVLVKLTNNLQVIWTKTINTHFMSGSYRPYIFFDSYNNILLGHRTGGGGGSTRAIAIQKFSTEGNEIWYKEASINSGYYLDIDSSDNTWVAGKWDPYWGKSYFSISKISSSGNVTQLYYDTLIAHTIRALAVKAENDFYILGNCSEGSYLGEYTCSPTDSRFLAHYSPAVTSIKENTPSNFSLHPNPTSGKFSIQFNEPLKEGKICIYNVLGECVKNIPLPPSKGDSFQIDLSSRSKGIYFLEMNYDNKKEVRKVIVN